MLSIAAAASVSAFSVSLDSPDAGASVAAGEVKFGFTAGGQSPMACTVLVNGADAANVTAQKNLPVIARADVSAGEWMWSVRCVDSAGGSGESEERSLTVTSFVEPLPSTESPESPSASPELFSASPDAAAESVAATEVPTPEIPKPDVAGSLSSFVVTRGGERDDSAVLQSWRSSVGRAVEFAALFSNDGANALNVSLKVTITGESASSDEELRESVVASLDSGFASVASGEKRVFGVVWTPQAEGVYTVEARVVSGVNSSVDSSVDSTGVEGVESADGSFGKAFLQLNVVRSANADWLFLLALACVAVVLIAVFKTRANAKAIKGGGLN